jgi:pimeloyl-ACP methyl ester carboxylesterase
MRSSSKGAAALGLVALLALGCATPSGVRHVSERVAYQQLDANVLSTGNPSAASRQVLLRQGLFEGFAKDPEASLKKLHEFTLADMDADGLFALAEYSELLGERRKDPKHTLAAALYAYAFLIDDEGRTFPNLLDPRVRLAADLYNRAVAKSIVHAGGPEKLGTIGLPDYMGHIDVSFDEASLHWAGRQFTDFVPAHDLEVRGLRNRYRRPGLGAAFAVAPVAEPGAELSPEDKLIAGRIRLPISFFLRIPAPRGALRAGNFDTRLELYNSREDDTIEVGARQIAVEYETSVALALALDGAPVWDTEIAGFRNPRAVPEEGALYTWGPHQRGRVPVVFVHGTASSAARWAEMLNELESDPRIRKHYEFWFFTYPTGNPILYSADLLRGWLKRAVDVLDPKGTDPGLQRMVLIGHSQGGLLVKLQVTKSGDVFWNNISETPFADANLDPKTRTLLSQALFIEPLPFVKSVVFISTPQQGSYLAGNWMGRIGRRLTQAPGRLLGLPLTLAEAGLALPTAAAEAVQGKDDARLQRQMERIPSSIDNMNPNTPFVKTLAALPITPGVDVHSIIPVKGGPPPDGQNDGVVAYQSAHLPGVGTELVVFNHDHSVQSSPAAIEEVRRILLEQLGATP